MPSKYVRKAGASPRGEWTEDALREAFEEIRQNKYGLNEISRRYGIPARTLKRRFAKQDTTKLTLWKHPVLDFDN
ncbi:unnamed protein product [Arctia plantaginis]|uniref:HTH psq-type domain-containing protein n=1 Tax=Arctia plantaginis TaxID=874455 RepID=A0A8S1BIR5_ARCPL|nr:unnamed protein product [Arctia plantaginis]